MMETVSVRCNHCGAPLSVGSKTRFVTCQFCNCQLEVRRTDSSVFTEEISRIAETTGQMAESLEVIRIQNEIERVDREWQASQPAPGSSSSSSGPTGVAGLVVSVIFAMICFSMAGSVGSFGPPIFQLVPVGMGIFALVAGVTGLVKSQSRSSDRKSFMQRRSALVRELNRRQQGAPAARKNPRRGGPAAGL